MALSRLLCAAALAATASIAQATFSTEVSVDGAVASFSDWLDGSSTVTIKVKSTDGISFDSNAPPDWTSSSFITVPTGLTVTATASAGAEGTLGYVSYTLAPSSGSSISAGTYSFSFPDNGFTDLASTPTTSSGLCASNSCDLQIGFSLSAVSITTTAGSAPTETWLAQTGSRYQLRIASSDQSLTMATAWAADATPGQDLAAIATASTKSGGGSLSWAAPSSSTVDASTAGLAVLPIDLTSTAPGTYAIVVPSGAICTAAGVCNIAASNSLQPTVKVGFAASALAFVLSSDSGNADVTDWVAKTGSYSVVVTTIQSGLTLATTALATSSSTSAIRFNNGGYDTGITFSAGTATSTTIKYPITLTGTSRGYGTFTISVAEAAMCTSNGYACNFDPALTTAVTTTMALGFELSAVSITNRAGSSAPTETWLAKSSSLYSLLVTASDSSVTMAAAFAPAVTPGQNLAAIATASTQSGGGSLSWATTGSVTRVSGSNYKAIIPIDMSATSVGTYTVIVPNGAVCLSNGACNVAAPSGASTQPTLKVGFTVASIAFVAASDTNNVAVTDRVSKTGSYALLVTTAQTGLTLATTALATSSSTSAIRFNNGGYDTGITFSAGTATSTTIKYPITLTGTSRSYGTFTISVAEAAMCSDDGYACNAAPSVTSTTVTTTMALGFDISGVAILKSFSSSYSETWLARAGGKYQVSITATDHTLSMPTTVSSSGTGLHMTAIASAATGGTLTWTAGTATASPNAYSTAVNVDLSATTPGTYTIIIPSGAVCLSSGACNVAAPSGASTQPTMQVGFPISAVRFVKASDATNTAVSDWVTTTGSGTYSVYLTTSITGLTLATTAPAVTTSTTAGLKFTNARVSQADNGVALSTGTAVTNGVKFPLDLTSLSTSYGSFTINVQEAVLCTADGSACNYDPSITSTTLTATMKVGFDISAASLTLANGNAITETWLTKATGAANRYAILVDAGSSSSIALTTSSTYNNLNNLPDTSSFGGTVTMTAGTMTNPQTYQVRIVFSFPSTLAYGTHTLDIPAGAICVTGATYCNAYMASQLSVNIGFELSLVDFVASSAVTTSSATTWVSKTTADTFAVLLRAPSSGVTLSTTASDHDSSKITFAGPTGTDATSSFTAADGANVAAATSPYGPGIKFTLDFSALTTYGIYSFAVVDGAICTASAAACNAPTVAVSASNLKTTLRVGFDVSSVAIKMASDGTTTPAESWLSKTTAGRYAVAVVATDTAVSISTTAAHHSLTGTLTPSSPMTLAVTGTLAHLNSHNYELAAPITMSGTNIAGKYTLALPAGAFCSASSATTGYYCSAAFSPGSAVNLWVGFDLSTLTPVITATDTTTVPTTWVSRTTANTYALLVRTSQTSSTLSTAAGDQDTTKFAWKDASNAAVTSGIAYQTGAAPTVVTGQSGLKFGLDFTALAYGAYTVSVDAGAVCTTSGAICNAPSTLNSSPLSSSLKVGFDVAADIFATGTTTPSVLTKWLSPSRTSVYDVIVQPAVGVTGVTVATAASLSTTVLAGLAGTFTVAGDGSKATATITSMTGITPGQYSWSVQAGKLCTASSAACNAELTGVAVKIGFELAVTVRDTSGNDITSTWSNPSSVLKVQVGIANGYSVTFSSTYTSTTAPSMATLFSTFTRLAETTSARTASTTAIAYKLTTQHDTAEGSYTMDADDGVVCTTGSTACNVALTSAVTVKVGYPLQVSWLDNTTPTLNVTTKWFHASDLVLLSFKRYSGSLEAATSAPSYASLFSPTAPISSGTSTTYSATEYRYSINCVTLVPGQYVFSIAQGATNNGDATAANFAKNYAGSITLLIGFETDVTVRDQFDADATLKWQHPLSTFSLRIFSTSSNVVNLASTYSTTPPAFTTAVTSTQTISSTAAAYVTAVQVGTAPYLQYRIGTGLAAGIKAVTIVQGTISNGLTGSSEIRNADHAMDMLIGFVPAVHVVDSDGRASRATDYIEGIWDADQTTVTQEAIPSFTKDFLITVTYGSASDTIKMKSFSATELDALAYTSTLTWPDVLDHPTAANQTSTMITYPVLQRKAVPGVYEIAVNQGVFSDTTAVGGTAASSTGPVMNAQMKVRLVLGVLFSLLTVDGATTLASRGAGGTAFTNLQAVRLRMRGINDNTLTLQQIMYDIVDSTFKSVYMLVNGRVLRPVASTSLSLDYAMDITALPDGAYTGTINSTGPLFDTVAVNQIWQPQSFSFVVDRTPPAVDVTFASVGTVYIGSTTDISIPVGLFTDAFSTLATQLTVSSIASRDMHALVKTKIDNSLGWTVANTVLRPVPSLRGPTGPATFVVSVTDEAGNVAAANLTMSIIAKPTPGLEVQDNRGVKASDSDDGVLYTGGGGSAICPSAGNCNINFVIIAVYPVAIVPITQSALTVAITSAISHSYSISSFTASSDGRKYTWNVAVSGLASGSTVAFSTAADISTTVREGFSVGASATVQATVDLVAPSLSGNSTYTAVWRATVNVPFTYNLSCSVGACALDMFTDAVTAAGSIQLVSSSPASFGGLSFYSGTQGQAYFSGSALFSPKTGYMDFLITAADAAGNTAARNLRLYVSSADPEARLVSVRDALSFKENAAGVPLFPKATWSYSRAGVPVSIDSAYVYLSNSEASGEVITGTAPDGTFETRSRDEATGTAVYYITQSTDAGIRPAAVQSWINSLTYTNVLTDFGTGTRTIRLELVNGTSNAVIASTSRPLTLAVVNNPPLLNGQQTVTWTEAAAGAKASAQDTAVLPWASVSDLDDTMMQLAVLTLLDCDRTRDELYVLPGYVAAPRVRGVWSTASCMLVLRSVDSPDPMTTSELQTALRSVMYTNKDLYDPTNRVPGPLGKRISAFVQDAGTSSRAPPARSPVATWNITIETADDPPVYLPDAAFAQGGLLYSDDAYANIRVLAIGSVSYKQRAFHVMRPAPNADGTVATSTTVISFDLTAIAGKPGYFAKGAIFDPDTTAAPASNAPIRALFVVGQFDYELDAPQENVHSILGTSWNSVTWAYDSQGASTLTVVLDSDLPDASLGPSQWRIYYNGAFSFDFWIDVRSAGCTLSDATNYVLAGDATMSVTAFYPNNIACTFAPLVLTDGDDPKASRALSRGGFDAKQADMATKVTALAATGLPLAAQVMAMAEERATARGTYQLAWTGRVLDAVASLSLTADVADTAALTASQLPSVQEAAGPIDTSLVLKLGPAGSTFMKPIRVCVHVGDTAAGNSRMLYKASQIDPLDQGRGYGPWRMAVNSTFNVVTGEVCGDITSFSLVASGLLPVATSPVVPKYGLMSASCPSMCHSNGHCRSFGLCECFPGFQGVDCRERLCPAGPSWSTNTDYGSWQVKVHDQAECSGAGTCDRETGMCQCYDTFEGAACQRAKCPNGCSGHGACRMLGELPAVQRAGYRGWELDRLTRCVCDSGFTGWDCSERMCPFGDDVETVCSNTRRAVQKVTIAFDTYPSGAVLNGNEFVLTFISKQDLRYTTPRISNIWDGTVMTTTNIQNAIATLPNFVADEVAVSVGDGTNVHREYLITFTGSTVVGDQLLMSCPGDTNGVIGCPFPGCQPKYQQLRLTNAFPSVGVVANWSSTLLQTPTPLDEGDEFESFTYAATVTVVARRRLVTAVSSLPMQRIEFVTWEVTTLIYNKNASTTDTTRYAPFVIESPIPPQGELRLAIPLFFGLAVDLPDDDTLLVPGLDLGSALSTATYTFQWRLPSCSVQAAVLADSDLESVECGNRGMCNRKTGECQCFSGYSGHTCSGKDETE